MRRITRVRSGFPAARACRVSGIALWLLLITAVTLPDVPVFAGIPDRSLEEGRAADRAAYALIQMNYPRPSPQSMPAMRSGFCTSKEPVGILRCYADAIANRNYAAFMSLLAPDYECIYLWDSDSLSVDRLALMMWAIRNMYLRKSLFLSVTFGDDHFVNPGQEPGTWRIEGVTSEWKPSCPHVPEWSRASGSTIRSNLFLRKLATRYPCYQIYREERILIRDTGN